NTDADTKYVVVVVTSVEQSRIPEALQVEVGEESTEYEPPYSIKKSLLPWPEPSIRPVEKAAFIISGNLASDYQVFSTAPVMDASLDFDAVYAIFDFLVSEYPEYVSRSLLTYETSGLPVYRYDFVPPTTESF